MYVYRLVHSKKDVLRVDLRRKSKEILLGSFLFLPEFWILSNRKNFENLKNYGTATNVP